MRNIRIPGKAYAAVIFVLMLFAGGCVTSSEQSEKEPVFDLTSTGIMIADRTDRFTAAHITKDTAFLNNIFTADARIYPPNSEAVTGRAAIAQLNRDWVNYGIHEFTEESSRIYGSGDYVVDEGTYTLRFGEENIVDRGKYINIWKMEDGEWKIFANIWNTSLPADIMEGGEAL